MTSRDRLRRAALGRRRGSTAGGFRTIRYAVRGAVATITLHRPHVLNAYNVEMRDELFTVLQAVDDDREIRVLVLQGAGRAFSSGGDVSEFGTAPSPLRARWVRWRRDVWGLLRSLPTVTVAAVHGYAAGSGLEMALLCDIIVLADDAMLLLPECGLGMIPGVGGTQTLPRAVGLGRALEMVLTGARVDAREAVRIALANRVVARRQLRRSVHELAHRIAALPAEAVAGVRRCINEGIELSLSEGLALEGRIAGGLNPTKGRRV
jgi:enoyl-CoA hydratase/carnithine racemase